MPAILTLDYKYRPKNLPWFHKEFQTYQELIKWLREDSIIILPDHLLSNKELETKLVLTKLALPRSIIIVISNSCCENKHSLFEICPEEDLEKIIDSAIHNKHKILDNRDNLKEVINYLI
jgi:hypothetical protein